MELLHVRQTVLYSEEFETLQIWAVFSKLRESLLEEKEPTA